MDASALKDRRPNCLMHQARLRGWLIPIGLILVLTSNIIALMLPFLDIDVVLKGHSEYKLPESVKLMWEMKLYLVSVLIVIFSIIFPIAKTVALIITWFLKLRPDRRKRFIRVLESLGKWSMLDIFVVILLMVLANDQIFLSTIPRSGLLFFIFAIIGNMIMSRIMERVDDRLNPPEELRSDDDAGFMPLDSTGPVGWAVPLLLVISFVSIVIAVDIPFLRINDILLRSHAYSVVEATHALWNESRLVLGLFLICFVGLLPAIRILLIGRLWFGRHDIATHYKRLDFIRVIGEWSMMSVFLLALGMLLTEGGALVRTEIKSGLWAILVSTMICVFSLWIARWLLNRSIRRRLRTGSDAVSASE
jgi:paraquat-inducible protein A